MSTISSTSTAPTRAPDQIMNPADKAFAKIEEELRNPPQEARGNPLAIAITSWVVGVFTLLLSYLHSALRNLHDFNADILARIDAIEEAVHPDHTSNESGGAPTNRAVSGASRVAETVAAGLESSPQHRAEAPARGGAAARRQQRCSKCHARGHSPQSCMTTDPASMRKRIAGNQKARRSARSKATPGPIPVLAPPPPHPLYAAYAAPADTTLMSTIANAEELRRRKRQSGRDRKKHRAATAIPG